ncbi:hypothetical protein K438DRAFT_1495037, partial [Mycena galopus ATCC 62051]
IQKRSISVQTARQWLKKLDWHFGCCKNGMYVDGNEAAFVKHWLEHYELRIMEYNDSKMIKEPAGYVLKEKFKGRPFKLILVTHDESTFYANDRKVVWFSKIGKNLPQPKGEGKSIRVS